MSVCPNSYESGCRCVEHDRGLMNYSPDQGAYEAMIARFRRQGVRLSVVTMPPNALDACAGTMTCPCQRCVRDRVTRPALGSGAAHAGLARPRPATRAA